MRAGRAITSLFAVTAFFGAGMLFLVQPMIARLLLPSYGGSATVWSTSSLFFQIVLLLGYVYSDRATRIRPSRLRLLHAVVLLTPLLVLPLALPGDAAPGAGTSPILWLLRTLALMIGLPFAVLATTGPCCRGGTRGAASAVRRTRTSCSLRATSAASWACSAIPSWSSRS